MKKIILRLTGVIGLVCLISGVAVYASSQFVLREHKSLLDSMITEQFSLLRELAERTDHNGIDASSENVVIDCHTKERERFDSLLNRLSGLDKSELTEVDYLFAACGNYDSEIKALTVARLKRELFLFKNLIELRTSLTTGDPDVYQLAAWEQLVAFEEERSDILAEQSRLQRDIIIELRGGNNAGSVPVTEMVKKAQELSDSAIVLNTQIDELRQDLSAL